MAFSSEIFGANTGTSIAKRKAAQNAGEKVADEGRFGDSMIIHASPFTQKLLTSMGGAGSFNPKTGMMEFFNVDEAVKRRMKKGY